MKILILMPLDERYVYWSQAIYQALDDEVKKVTLAIPMFADYLKTIKYGGDVNNDWLYPMTFALYTANKMCKTVKKKDDLVIIGNVSKDYESSAFDLIFNFQDDQYRLEYADPWLTKMKEIVRGEASVERLINNMHKANESLYPLTNCGATGIFISDLIKSGKPLKKLEEKYENLLKKVDNIKIKNGN